MGAKATDSALDHNDASQQACATACRSFLQQIEDVVLEVWCSPPGTLQLQSGRMATPWLPSLSKLRVDGLPEAKHPWTGRPSSRLRGHARLVHSMLEPWSAEGHQRRLKGLLLKSRDMNLQDL